MKEQTKGLGKWIGLSVLIIVIGIIVGAVIYIYLSLEKTDQLFVKGVSVEGITLGGLTFPEGSAKIDALLKEEERKELILYNESKEVVLPYNALGIHYNTEEILKKAFAIGKDSSFIERYRTAKDGITPLNLQIERVYNQNTIEAALTNQESVFLVSPIDATIKRENKQFIITREVEGKKLNVKETAVLIEKALKENSTSKIEVAMEKALPKYTVESFNDIQTPVASFHTNYNNADPSRNTNLKVATNRINKVLQPGEVFSLANQLEPIDATSGYRPSKVIVNGRLEDGIGGGVCQVASTLYNAILLSNLDITVRQNHSLPVAYVPLGRDATYATGIIDFKFKNNSDQLVFIESYCENNKVYVNIFGNEKLKPEYDEIKFLSELIEVVPAPPTTYKEDATLEKGKKLQELPPLEGKKVKLYKLYYKQGKLMKKELVNQSYYRPRGEVVKVGTKEVAPVISPVETPLPTPTPQEDFLGEWPAIDLTDTTDTPTLE